MAKSITQNAMHPTSNFVCGKSGTNAKSAKYICAILMIPEALSSCVDEPHVPSCLVTGKSILIY